MRKIITFSLPFFMVSFSFSQGAIDGFFKSKGDLDLAISGAYGFAPEYYAGTNLISYKRNQSLLSLYANYGLSDKWNVIASVPVINLQFQDASVYAKYKLMDKSYKKGRFSVFPAAGVSFPLWKYETESGQAIGQRAVLLQPILVGQYKFNSGLFFNGQLRYNYAFDPVPSSINASAKVGYAGSRFYTDFWFEYQNGYGDKDYQGSVPYDSFRELTTSFQRIGGVLYYSFSNKIGGFINSSYVLNGRNISKTLSFGGGVVFKFT